VRELGLFSGTFNPIHVGHLLIAECARDQFSLEKVIFIPARKPPHKKEDLLDPEARLDMVESAIVDNPYFESSRVELDRDGPSYTVDTVRHFRMLFPDARLNLIVGGDNAPFVHQWHEAEELLKMARLLMAPRPQPVENGQPVQAGDSAIIEVPEFAISSSAIRERIRQNGSILYMVPPGVHAQIQKHGYYREGTGS
jgi:nicotinate-nucleotide adenylyltransferase